jgi:hypothetical protein
MIEQLELFVAIVAAVVLQPVAVLLTQAEPAAWAQKKEQWQ